MTSRDSQWYSKLKRITNYEQTKSETVQVDEISHLPDQEQAEAIASSFSSISNEYDPVNREEIQLASFCSSEVPQFKPYQVRRYLDKIKTNKSTAPGDIPAKIIKECPCFGCSKLRPDAWAVAKYLQEGNHNPNTKAVSSGDNGIASANFELV